MVMKLPVEWSDFYITNALVVVLGAVQAAVAETLPLAPLAYAALMIVNAIFFHILPFARGGGRFSPGLATALILFFPWRSPYGVVPGTTACSRPGRLHLCRARRAADGLSRRDAQTAFETLFPARPALSHAQGPVSCARYDQ